MRAKLLGLTAALPLLFLGTLEQASSATVSGTFAGTFCSGSCGNVGSIQGVDASSLAGDAISGTFSFNTAGFVLQGPSSIYYNSPGVPTFDGNGFPPGYGGTGTISATATIDGYNFTSLGSSFSQIQTYLPPDSPPDGLFLYGGDTFSSGGIYEYLYITGPSLYTDGSDLTTISFSGVSGTLIISGFDNTTDQIESHWRVPVTFSAATTPLPAALPLFATGLGVLGLFGWRRKRKNSTAFAA